MRITVITKLIGRTLSEKPTAKKKNRNIKKVNSKRVKKETYVSPVRHVSRVTSAMFLGDFSSHRPGILGENSGKHARGAENESILQCLRWS